MDPTVFAARRAGVLYAGVAVFVVLALFTAQSIWSAWHVRSGEARAEAIVDLVGQRMPPRPTDAPGAMAWLRLELERYGGRLDPARERVYRSLAGASDRSPDELAPVASALDPASEPAGKGVVQLGPSRDAGASASLRRQRLVMWTDAVCAITRRRALDDSADAASASNRFVIDAVPRLVRIRRDLDDALRARPMPAVAGDEPPRPVRAYAVAEDGTLVSCPWITSAPSAGAGADGAAGGQAGGAVTGGQPGAASAAAERELDLLSARPGLPSFPPEEFFFRFDPASTSAGASYSGFYLDLGGRGLVATLTRALRRSDTETMSGVIAVDLAFDVDWSAVARSVSAPVVSAAVHLTDTRPATWAALAQALGADTAAPLRAAVTDLATRAPQAGDDRSPLRHGLVDSAGAVAAFQVSDRTWLVMLFPRTAPAFPLAAVGLLTGLLALLLAAFEFNRRRAEGERQKAERALREKQNLLNTMQVPLVVVDPNTDAIVSSNRAAEAVGIRAGARFADLVWPDDRARAHYQQMQIASAEPRRAYGVPMAVRDEQGRVVQRYAVVRSVAVTAPIEALAADERHRLGVLFVLDPQADLALLAEEIAHTAQRDERRRLAGLLSHGVETLARVLEQALRDDRQDPSRRELTAWLADYVERRVTVAGWLLEHWDAAPPLARESVVTREQFDATLARLAQILRFVRDERDLRARLHWGNGTLSQPSPDGRVLDTAIDWPPAFEITVPVRGGVGLFLAEVVANAVRHGRPGTVPRLEVRADRVRRELVFQIENEQARPDERLPEGEPYGGLAILRAMARLFDWPDLTFQPAGDRFIVRWRVPVSDRGSAGQPD
jgi:hypothetical protein